MSTPDALSPVWPQRYEAPPALVRRIMDGDGTVEDARTYLAGEWRSTAGKVTEACIGVLLAAPLASSCAPVDDPEMDATDQAHPAWWRGNEAGVRSVVVAITRLLDGEPRAGTHGYAPLEALAQLLHDMRPFVSPSIQGERDRAESPCACRACRATRADDRIAFTVCEVCGNKRCPHATDHRHACTNSNAPDQPGSVFGGLAAPTDETQREEG